MDARKQLRSPVPDEKPPARFQRKRAEARRICILRHEGVASPKILLVTSAFHMKRSVLMFRKYAPEIEVVPAPSDFEIVAGCDEPLTFTSFLPNVHALARNSVHFKEFVGYWGYRLFK